MSREPYKNNVPALRTMILKDTEITGELTVISGDLLLVGKVCGDIQCSGCVEISEEGRVSGNILCDILDLNGTVEGNVKTNLLRLREQGSVTGEVETSRLRVHGERINISTLRIIEF